MLFIHSRKRPSSRMVLLNRFSADGFTFYTHKTSRKGLQLGENPNACLLFYWPILNRQIRIEGTVYELPPESADDVWNSWPMSSRIGFKSSQQSSITTRTKMEQSKKDLDQKVEAERDQAACRPERWIGYSLAPRYFEFWQGHDDRLHDRIVFDKEQHAGEEVGDGWHTYRLSP